jgi:endonuclease-3
MKTEQEVRCIVEELKNLYPEGICSLNYEKDYELLVSVRLSAQCTDERVNQVTPALFARFPTLHALAEADVSEVEEYVHSCGFFRAKARDIVASAQMLITQYGGKVPSTMEELLSLPGVGRKTANLLLGDIYGEPGVVVADTHCIRITGLLGLTDGTKDPGKVEQQLRAVLPPEESNDFCHRMVLHGRAVCVARRPDCGNCTLRIWCDHFQKSEEDC